MCHQCCQTVPLLTMTDPAALLLDTPHVYSMCSYVGRTSRQGSSSLITVWCVTSAVKLFHSFDMPYRHTSSHLHKGKGCVQLLMELHLTATECHLLYGITVLPSTLHKWIHPALTTARQAGTRFTHAGGMEGWVDLDGWLYTETVYLPVSSHPSK